MVKAIIFDFSRVLLNAKDQSYSGGLNALHKDLKVGSAYSIFDHFELNQRLLDYLQSIKDKFDLYIFTTGSIQDEPEIRLTLEPIFKGIFSMGEVGFLKHDPKAYIELAKRLKINPEESLFIDDSPQNVEAARASGMQGIIFLSNDQLFKKFNEILGD